MISSLLSVLLVAAGIDAAQFNFGRARDFEVTGPAGPHATFKSLHEFLTWLGLADATTRAGLFCRRVDEYWVRLEVDPRRESPVREWCDRHGFFMTSKRDTAEPAAYADGSIRRKFDALNDDLRALAVDLLRTDGRSAEARVEQFKADLNARGGDIPYEGGRLNLSREASKLARAAQYLTPPDLGRLEHPPLPRGPVDVSGAPDRPTLHRTADRLNRMSQRDFERLAEAKPHMRNVIESWQKTLAHQQGSSQDQLWLEARLKIIDEILFRRTYAFDEGHMNAETYEVAAEAFLRTFDAFDAARAEGRLFDFEVTESLDRQLTLSARWLVELDEIGPRAERLFERLAARRI